jgi:tetratricopeptide (TPR) repeat protein
VARPPASTALQIERPEIRLSEESIPATEALYRLARFLGQMENTRDDGRRFLDAVLTIDPAHARSVAAHGLSRHYEAKYGEATPLFEKALAMAPHDPEVQLAAAEALLRHAVGPFVGTADLSADAQPRFRRARELATAAMHAGPSPLAEAIVGASYLVEDDVTPGIESLEKAYAARPGRRDFALNLYALYLRADRLEDADRIFNSFFTRPRNAEALPIARATWVRERIIKVNRMIGNGQLEEAVTLLGEIVASSPDETVRSTFLDQASKLQRIIDRNRQVLLYNEAVTAFNEKRLEAALERCDRLLESSVDRDIREQTERLRTRTRARLGM